MDKVSGSAGDREGRAIFVRYRHGTEIPIRPNIKSVLRPLVEQLKAQQDHRTFFRNLVRDIADGSGPGIAPDSTWPATLRELFTDFEREQLLDEPTKQALAGLIEMLVSDESLDNSWDAVKVYLIANADILSGWQELKKIRSVSFFGDIQRDSDGTYYYIGDSGERIQVIGAKTAAEERFEYIAEDAMGRYGRIGRILRLVSLFDIADQYSRHPDHFSERTVCWLPDNTNWTAYLQWSWHIRDMYHYVPAPWKPRSNFSDPEWLAADLIGAFPETRDLSEETLSPPQDQNLKQFTEASAGNPYQYDLALQTDLFLSNRPEVWFDFEGRKIRWINGTRFVYPTLTVWSKTDEEGSEVATRFLSVLVKEARTSIVELDAGGGSAAYYPRIRQPRTLGGLGLDPRYLLAEDTTKFSDRKWLALALYKEGVNSNSVYYSFLCFYKILELALHDNESRINQWIDANIDAILQRRDPHWKQEVLSSGQTSSLHFRDARRHAVAHIGRGGRLRSGAAGVNPDDPNHYRAFSRDVRVMRELADKTFEQRIV